MSNSPADLGGEHSREINLSDHLLVEERRPSRILHIQLLELWDKTTVIRMMTSIESLFMLDCTFNDHRDKVTLTRCHTLDPSSASDSPRCREEWLEIRLPG